MMKFTAVQISIISIFVLLEQIQPISQLPHETAIFATFYYLIYYYFSLSHCQIYKTFNV